MNDLALLIEGCGDETLTAEYGSRPEPIGEQLSRCRMPLRSGGRDGRFRANRRLERCHRAGQDRKPYNLSSTRSKVGSEICGQNRRRFRR